MLKNLTASFDYLQLIKEARRLPALPPGTGVRIAVLGDCATQQFVAILRVLLLRSGITPEIYETGFDTVQTEVFDRNSALHAFRPQIVVLFLTTQAFRQRFYATEEKSLVAEQVLQDLREVWTTLHESTGARIVASNFALPSERFFGSFECRVDDSLAATVASLNRALVMEARTREDLFVFDVDYVAGWVGRRSFFDERLWVTAKVPCALEYLPQIAQSAVDVVCACLGAGVKCLVLDLDNTLWGGVIGDDGLEGIELASHGPGEEFHGFQHYLKELARRGILLTVCSKNEMEAALLPFRQHPEMVLREHQITLFVANWENKAQNIAHIKESLGIGYDSMVFLDDNPFERNLVREMLPEVVVPELPEDPADWVKALGALNLFEAAGFTSEDRARGDLYRVAADRDQWRRRYADIDDYLRSLEMKVVLRRFQPADIPRVAQLLQRSNQFNLCTRRFSEAQCRSFMEAESTYPVCVRLADRFGDHGLVGVAIAHAEGTQLRIDEYAMSCRVLQRGLENYTINALVAWARARGLSEVRGTYIPTAKNAMVKDFYARFGFEPVGREPAGATAWRLAVETYEPRPALMTAADAVLA